MKTIRVTAMLVLGLTALSALAQEAAPSTPSTESTASTDPKPGEERTFAGIAFVWIPPGSFTMGSPASEEGHSDAEGPQHKVTFAEGFWMGKYEVTQAEWQAVMVNNPSFFKWSARLPVECVLWDDCQTLIKKLNEKGEGTFRLPSEAEWEYACRAGTTTPLSFEETISNDQATSMLGNETTDVGSFPPNAWGLYDMHGNVWEWCQDSWHDNFEGAPTDGSAWEWPGGDYRVVRGISWFRCPFFCRAANRFDSSPDSPNYNIGLRLVRTL